MNTFDKLKSKFKNHFQHENILMINADCMDVLKECDSNEFDVAIIDPPYGIGESGDKNSTRSKLAVAKDYKPYLCRDVNAPPDMFFKSLEFIAKDRIIFGANHFIDNIENASSPSWIVWDKLNGDNDFADCELAYTSFKKAVRKFSFRWSGMLQGDMSKKECRIHPNQKPVKLYQWIYENYLEREMSVIDTHLGSASNVIAAYYFGCKFVGVEIDKHYFDLSVKRVQEETKQVMLL